MFSSIGTSLKQFEQQEWFGHKFIPGIFRALVWGYAAFAILCSFPSPVSKFDDAIPLVHGLLVQQGMTPNLDFYSFYPPLSLYLTAASFTLLGRTVLAVRVIAALLYLCVLYLVVRFFRSYFGSPGPLTSASVLLVATSIGGAITMAVWPGFAFSLIALLTYLCAQKSKRYRVWGVAGAGVLTGLTLLCRINFGGYVLMVIGVDLLLRWWFRRESRWDPVPLKADIFTALAFGIPLVVCFAGVCYWIYGSQIGVAVTEFVVTAQKVMRLRGFLKLIADWNVACAVAFPTAWYLFRLLKGADVVPVKAVIAAAFSTALLAVTFLGYSSTSIVWILTLLEIASVIFLHVFVYRLEQAEFSLLLFYCCLLHYFLSRADLSHVRLLPISCALLIPLLLVSRNIPGTGQSDQATSKGTALAILTVAMFVLSASPEFRPPPTYFVRGVTLLADLVRHSRMADTDVILAAGEIPPEWAAVYDDADELRTLRYLEGRADKSAPIFVGVEDHSTLYWNNLRMYWLASRPIGVRTFQLETKVATESSVQREIVADLTRNNVNWLIIDTQRDWGDGGKPYKGSEILDKYIASVFREEARFGRYSIMSRD